VTLRQLEEGQNGRSRGCQDLPRPTIYPFRQMSRFAAIAVATLVIGLGTTVLGRTVTAAEEAAPPTTVPATAVATVAPTTAVPAVTTPLPARAGTETVDVTKDDDEVWSPRRIGITVGLVVVGLAAAGFVYGRIRSSPRRSSSSALVASSD
jgi:hypothetical protein